MKIQRLIIKNVASIVDADIDFSNGPLASDPIFLISGDTGSGKSTILNAICLALYDEVPALAEQTNKVSDREGIALNHSSQLMRKGAVEASVELYFLGNDDRRYLMQWSVWRARKSVTGKIKKTHTFTSLADGVCYSLQSEVKNMVAQVVGLSFEQFTRTTMLAQGQFASFLKAKDKDKSDILEKITGTDIFARIGIAVNEIAKTKKYEYDVLQAQVNSVSLLSETERQAMLAQIADLSEKIKTGESDIKLLSQHISWLNILDQKSRLLSQKSSAVATAQEAMTSDEAMRQKSLVAQYDATADVRRLLYEQRVAQKSVDALERQIQSLATTQWHQVLDAIAWLEVACRQKMAAAAEIEAQVDSRKPFSCIWSMAPRIDVLAAAVRKYAEDRDTHLSKHRSLLAEAEKSKAAEAPLLDKLSQAEARFSAAESALMVKEEAARGYDLSDIKVKIDEAFSRMSRAQQSIKAVETFHRSSHDYADTVKALDEANASISECSALLAKDEALLPDAVSSHERLEAFAQGQMQLKDHIASLRTIFSQSHACPLCGSEGVHLHSDEAIDVKVAQAKATADEALALLTGLRSSIAKYKAEIEVKRRLVDRLSRDSVRYSELLDQARAQASALVVDFDSDEVLARLLASYREAQECHGSFVKLLEAAQHAINDLDVARRGMDKARADKESAAAALDKRRADTLAISQEASRVADLAAACSKEAESAVHSISDMLRGAPHDVYQQFMALIYAQCGISVIDVSSAAALARFVVDSAKAFDADSERLISVASAVKDLECRITVAKDDISAVSGRFSSAYTPVPKECADLPMMIRSLIEDTHRIDGQLSAERAKLDSLTGQIAQWVEASDFSMEQLLQVAALPESLVDRCRAAIKEADDRLKRAVYECEMATVQFKEHQSIRPDGLADDVSVDALALQMSDMEHQVKAIGDSRALLSANLKSDDEAVRNLAQQRARLDALKDIKEKWEHLDSVFGTADGSRFKKIAQSWVLRVLLNNANSYLALLSKRYRLACDEGSLNINVIDSEQLGTVRDAGLLSGGETFVVSLALALGLSTISKDKIHVDTLFIDEGFGTLDRGILDTVLNVLDSLHKMHGRRIGIISHVEDLKDRIATQIRVTPCGTNTSTIEVIVT